MKEVMTTPDGIKLTAKYRAVYQNRNMKAEGRCMCVSNPKKQGQGLAASQLFDTPEEAKAELVKLIQKYNKGARIETTACGMIGIDLVINEEDAKYMEIVYWEIEKQWRSNWEVVESPEHPAKSE